MIVIACVANNFGLTFHNRRVSRDRAVITKIEEIAGSTPIWCAPLSFELFLDSTCNIKIAPQFFSLAQTGEYCFVEICDLSQVSQKIEGIVLFHWGRDYPADAFFNLNLANYALISQEVFGGNSHKSITLEIYKQKGYDDK